MATFDWQQGAPSCMKFMLFQLLFEQFHVLGSIHSGVKWNAIQTSSAMARHGTPNRLARQVLHCGYNIFLAKTITQEPRNVHVHGAFISKQHFLPLSESSGDDMWKVQSLFLHHWCGSHADMWDFSPFFFAEI